MHLSLDLYACTLYNHKSLLQATEALLSTEEEDTPTPSPTSKGGATVSSTAVAPSPAGAVRPPTHPLAAAPRPTAVTTVAPLNLNTTLAQPPSMVTQPSVQQQQVKTAGTPGTPSLPPVKVEDMHKWLYKDPQGEIQGV